MSIFGLLGLADNDRAFMAQIGQRVAFDAAEEYVRLHNAEVEQFLAVFLEATTEEYKERYKLPGGGRMQRRGGQAQSGAVKPYGGWDVAYPLEEFGDQLATDEVQAAYMTAGHLNNHMLTMRVRDMNNVRFEVLRALFNNTQRTFEDDHYGNLLIEPFANGDAVVYPPVFGSESQTTDNHYLASGYAASGISDTNNPFVTIRKELEEHFGTPAGFGNTVAFINDAQVDKVEDLTDYVPLDDRFVKPGQDTATLADGLPTVPGRIIGRSNGVWIVEWRWIPANYILAIDLDQPRPLKRRVDPAGTGLPRGLSLITESDEYPFAKAHYRHRFGLGVANRLNGVAMELTADASYDIPAAYA